MNSSISDFCIGLDSDDAMNYPRLPGVIYEINKRMGVNGTLNKISRKYQKKYETISFIGDDNLVRTKNWDALLNEPIDKKGYGLSYGNDLLRVDRLPTTIMISSNLIKILGYMAPPKIIHMYIDNFWMELGENLNALFYFEEVIVEHLHFSNGKSKFDSLYQVTNSPERFEKDISQFNLYKEKRFAKDLKKIRKRLRVN
jgi:hypothetical protein